MRGVAAPEVGAAKGAYAGYCPWRRAEIAPAAALSRGPKCFRCAAGYQSAAGPRPPCTSAQAGSPWRPAAPPSEISLRWCLPRIRPGQLAKRCAVNHASLAPVSQHRSAVLPAQTGRHGHSFFAMRGDGPGAIQVGAVKNHFAITRVCHFGHDQAATQVEHGRRLAVRTASTCARSTRGTCCDSSVISYCGQAWPAPPRSVTTPIWQRSYARPLSQDGFERAFSNTARPCISNGSSAAVDTASQ